VFGFAGNWKPKNSSPQLSEYPEASFLSFENCPTYHGFVWKFVMKTFPFKTTKNTENCTDSKTAENDLFILYLSLQILTLHAEFYFPWQKQKSQDFWTKSANRGLKAATH